MKKFLKKTLVLGMAALMSCGLIACGGGTEDDGGVDASGNTVVKVMFHVDAKSDEGMAYKKRVDAFNAEYKEEKLKISASYIARSAGATDYEQKLVGMQNEGTLPDIITFDAPNCASYAHSDLLYDITNLVPADVKSDFVTVNEYNGKLYGLPIQESSAGFFYNKQMFKDAGVDVSGYTVENPWTFDQFKEVCQKLKNSGIATPVDMRLADTKDEMATYLLYPIIYTAGGEYLSEDGMTATGYFNSAATKSGFQFIKDLVTSGYTSYSLNGTDFFDKKIAMYLSSGWTIPELDIKYRDNFPNRDAWGLLPYPKGSASAQGASATGSWSYGITNNHHKDKTATVKALLFLSSTESCRAITDATGMIPARKSSQKSYDAGSPESVLMQQLSLTGRSRPVTVGYPQFSNNFRQVIYGMKDKDLGTLLDEKAAALQSELNKLGKI